MVDTYEKIYQDLSDKTFLWICVAYDKQFVTQIYGWMTFDLLELIKLEIEKNPIEICLPEETDSVKCWLDVGMGDLSDIRIIPVYPTTVQMKPPPCVELAKATHKQAPAGEG